MIRAAFLFYKMSRAVFLTKKKNDENYFTVLNQTLHPLRTGHARGNCDVLFQYDNALIHTATVTRI